MAGIEQKQTSECRLTDKSGGCSRRRHWSKGDAVDGEYGVEGSRLLHSRGATGAVDTTCEGDGEGMAGSRGDEHRNHDNINGSLTKRLETKPCICRSGGRGGRPTCRHTFSPWLKHPASDGSRSVHAGDLTARKIC
jgi:hypothetical protein